MRTNRYDLLNFNRWNRRLLNLYWACNLIILATAFVIFLHYGNMHSPSFTREHHLYDLVLLPAVFISALTATCEAIVFLLRKNHRSLQPYVITITGVAYCSTLIAVHYTVNVLYISYFVPIVLSLIYDNKRILLLTFISSLCSLSGLYFIYPKVVDLPFLSISPAEIVTNVTLLLSAYLFCLLLLGRYREIIDILAEAEHAAYEFELAKSRAEGEADARRRFLANMSHEIRTPMNGILGLAELALDSEPLSSKQEDYLIKIKNSASGLLSIVNDVLDISKIDAGALELERIPFDLHEVLNECKAILSYRAAEKGLELYFHDMLPIDNKLLGDPTKLRQALLNILSNAVKFTKSGSVTLDVRCGEPSGGDKPEVTVSFAVSDTGIGITSEQRANIFDAFKQADDSTIRNFGGTGLGLSITKGIVELMGGEISVESIPHVGSKFSFSATFELSPEKALPREAKYGHAAGTGNAMFSGDVLLCEDNKINLQVAIENLEKLGLNVTAVKNGELGIDAVRRRMNEQREFDLILMDIHMPVMDGLEATRILVKMGTKTPIIAMTANAMAEDRDRCINAGMADYISKPFKPQVLRDCLAKHLAGKPSRNAHGGDAGVDVRLGVENCAENEVLYKELLAEFLENRRNTYDRLESLLLDKEYALAKRLAYSERCAAETLGAVRLSRVLSAFEDIEPGSLKAMLADYSAELDNTLEHISRLLLEPLNHTKIAANIADIE